MNPISATAQTPDCTTVKGRFAPSPTGRMHLGNIYTALISWLSVRKAGGKWLLRIEDLDPQRSKIEYARMIEDDLCWLALYPDEGGLAGVGDRGPYRQSDRGEIYAEALRQLQSTGYTYPCTCTRADIMATQAPHQSDGRIIYQGTCRPQSMPHFNTTSPTRPHATRLYVPDRDIHFHDKVYGHQCVNLTHECGDFVLQRADGAWAYQLAVVVDDALMGVTEVVRGNDLLLSTAQQLYLYELLGKTPPAFAHLPLLCNGSMRRLSKRDQSLSMEQLRRSYTPDEIIGKIAWLSGITDSYTPCRPEDLADTFSWKKIPAVPSITCTSIS